MSKLVPQKNLLVLIRKLFPGSLLQRWKW